MPITSLSPVRSTTQISPAVAWQHVQYEVSESVASKQCSTLKKIPTLFSELKILFERFFNVNEVQSSAPRFAVTELARIKAEVDQEFVLIDKIIVEIDQLSADIKESKNEWQRQSQINEIKREAHQAKIAALEEERPLKSELQGSDLLCEKGWLILEEMQRVMAELHDSIELEKAHLENENQEHTLTDQIQEILNGVEESFARVNSFAFSILETCDSYHENNNLDTPIWQAVTAQEGLCVIPAAPLVALLEATCAA